MSTQHRGVKLEQKERDMEKQETIAELQVSAATVLC